ncbi:MAG: hypothetical protein LBC28_04270 [Oscillospiraceae bacterium]|jgi:hypothetical protein|nr:hypothetical protein [Oscillospiraceae bacterium]
MGFLIAAAVITALLLLRVGVCFTSVPGSTTARVVVGFVGFTVFRRPEKRKGLRSASKKPRAPKRSKRRGKDVSEERRPRDVRALIEGSARLLGKLRRRVLVKRLYVRYVHSGLGDAYKAAMTFGGLSAALGLAAGTLESALRVRRYDMSEAVDFLAEKPVIYVDAAASLAVWEIIALATAAIALFLRSRPRR